VLYRRAPIFDILILVYRLCNSRRLGRTLCSHTTHGAFMQSISVKTTRRTQLLDITNDVQRIVTALGIRNGTCFLYVPHTTAGILINEHADPDVASDAEGALDRLVPASGPYRHAEGNSDSHVKTMLTGVTQFVFVEDGKLALGRWQGIFLAEFDGPRTRKILVKVLPDRV
jgi:secondary thiamine-phosphate synthase enzyme